MIQCEFLHHVSIVVRDLEKAKQFYAKVIGLQELQRPNFDFPGAWYAIGENHQLHLIVHPPAQTVRTEGGIDTRDGHFAIRVASYEATIDQLEKCGIPYKANPNSITGWKQVFCCDPDGNVIEMNCP